MEKTAEKQSLKEKLKNLWSYFSLYERIWFISILILSVIMAILFPEEDINGINGRLIMGFYLLNIASNVLCELLISKQSKWNFIVSLVVEVTEIIIPILLASRFATMATTVFFWIPIDIISFINWNKHRDRENAELTKVRKLNGWLKAVIIIAIAVWTIGVGYLISELDISTDFFKGNITLETAVCYLDACASALGICNGVFIFLRIREQWLAWFVASVIETLINILSGQYVLLVLKAGYFTNTVYGYIKWTKYIRSHNTDLDNTIL